MEIKMDEVISVVGAELQYQFQYSSSEQRERGFLVDATLGINPLMIYIAFNDDWYVWKVIATTEDGEEIDETEVWGDKLDAFLYIAFNDDWYVWKVIATTEEGEEIDETQVWGDKLDAFLTEF